MKTYSEKIEILKDFIETQFDFKVNLFSNDLPDDVCGRTYYQNKHVCLNCTTAKQTFFTLLHEAGHVMSYDKYFYKLLQNQPDVKIREHYAYLYGWVINKKLNLDVTKDEWRNENVENF